MKKSTTLLIIFCMFIVAGAIKTESDSLISASVILTGYYIVKQLEENNENKKE